MQRRKWRILVGPLTATTLLLASCSGSDANAGDDGVSEVDVHVGRPPPPQPSPTVDSSAPFLQSTEESDTNLRGDGTWKVGVDFRRPPTLESGPTVDRYVFDFQPTAESDSCYWAIRAEHEQHVSDRTVTEQKRVVIYIIPDVVELELRGCGDINLGGLEGPDAVSYPTKRDGVLGDGVWRAGVDFGEPPLQSPPDRYVFDHVSDGFCFWSTRGDKISSLGDGMVRGPGRVRILVRPGTYELDLSGCGEVYLGGRAGPEALPYEARMGQPLGDGVWRVGVDLPAVASGTTSTYVIQPPRRYDLIDYNYNCLWATYSLDGRREGGERFVGASRHEQGDTLPAEVSVVLTASTYELELSGCGEQDFLAPERRQVADTG